MHDIGWSGWGRAVCIKGEFFAQAPSSPPLQTHPVAGTRTLSDIRNTYAPIYIAKTYWVTPRFKGFFYLFINFWIHPKTLALFFNQFFRYSGKQP